MDELVADGILADWSNDEMRDGHCDADVDYGPYEDASELIDSTGGEDVAAVVVVVVAADDD